MCIASPRQQCSPNTVPIEKVGKSRRVLLILRVCRRLRGSSRSKSGNMDEEEPKDRGEFAVFEVYGKTLHYSKNSLFIFGQDNPLRVRVVKIVAHPWFDRFILFLILVNSAVLALTDWSVIDEDPASSTVGEPSQVGSWRNKLLYRSEPVFTAFFTIEFVLKVIAQGFCLQQGSYLRNAWNVLDFIVVVTALLSNIPEVPTMTAIRVFRVLRPLRSVSALPGLQKLVLAMLSSVPQLVSVVILLAFIFTVFGIFGVQIFGGKQHGRCRLTPYPVTNTFEVSKGAARTCVFNSIRKRIFNRICVLLIAGQPTSPATPSNDTLTPVATSNTG